MGVPHAPADRNKVFCTILSHLANKTPDLCLSLGQLPSGMSPAESQRILESFYGSKSVERTTELTDAVFGQVSTGAPYAFIEAEKHWDSLDLAGREALLRQIGEDPDDYDDLANRPWGTLDPNALDALEGMAMQDIQRKRGG